MASIKYLSTRDSSKRCISSSEAILRGIADDGGLFVPDKFPNLSSSFEKMKELDYKGLASFILGELFSDFTIDEIDYCTQNAYNTFKFDKGIVKISTYEKTSFLELFHGQTLAFKDMALSILPYLMKASIKKHNIKDKILILTATSGDTGKAALEGFAGIDGIDIIVFYPKNGVSNIQERQMLTQKGENVKVVAIRGNFDDAQSAVKYLLSDACINGKLKNKGYMFSSANSINIGRLVPQIVYYFYAYFNLVKNNVIINKENINICVPTGNFGNILAAFYAKKMGLPVNKLICASNKNNVLTDFFNDGIYNKNREFYTTISPSMDILISSNLERLLYHLSGEDPCYVSSLMDSLKNIGKYSINEKIKASLNDFYAGFSTEAETRKEIDRIFKKHSYVIDTHTAVASAVHNKYVAATGDNTHTIIAATASFYKFFRDVYSSISDKYDKNKDDFTLIDEMKKISNVNIPQAISDLKTADILHNTVIDKGDIVDSFINIAKL